MKKLLFSIALTLIGSAALTAQQNALEGAKQNYKQAKYDEVIAVLTPPSRSKDLKNNAEVWNYLGLAQFEKNNTKAARKSFEKAVMLAPSDDAYHVNLAYVYLLERKINKAQSELEVAIRLNPRSLGAYGLRGRSNLWEGKIEEAIRDADTALSIDPSYTSAYIVKADALLSRFGANTMDGAAPRGEVGILSQAMDILKTGISKARTSSDSKTLSDQFSLISAFYEHFTREKKPLDSAPDPGITPVKILSKPKAPYTDRARQANIQGTIRLAILFGASGKIEGILILKRLGYGLDENAYLAASQIKFEPKTVNGKPVPAVLTFEYGFNIY